MDLPVAAATPRLFYFYGPYLPQEWSLPDSIIYYIVKARTTLKFYQKLIRTCKYFYFKNPILEIESLYFNCAHQEWVISYKNAKIICLDLKNAVRKFWITDIFDNYVMNSPSDRVSSIISKLCQVEVKTLKLSSQNLTFKEFLFLSSNVETTVLYETFLTNEDGSIVPLEKMIEALPKVKNFQFIDNFTESFVTENTVKELIQIPHFSMIEKFKIMNFSETFDVEAIFAFIKQIKTMKCYLCFKRASAHNSISVSEEYIDRLNAIINEIFEADEYDYRPPFIEYDELDDEIKDALYSL